MTLVRRLFLVLGNRHAENERGFVSLAGLSPARLQIDIGNGAGALHIHLRGSACRSGISERQVRRKIVCVAFACSQNPKRRAL